MKEIIMRNHSKNNINNSHSKVNVNAVKRSTALGSIDEFCLDINLDELSEDPAIRSQELLSLLREKYAEEKKKFEQTHPVVRNGTYMREFVFLDPINETRVAVFIVMQRYKNKIDGHTQTFYGNLFMRRVPYLIRQVITILSEKAAYEISGQQKAAEERPNLQEYCRSWGITVKLYYAFFAKAMGLRPARLADCTREDFKKLLKSFCYG